MEFRNDPDLSEVSSIRYDNVSEEPKHLIKPRHLRDASGKPQHLKKESAKPKILKGVISVELILVILSCYTIYMVWCHNLEVLYFGDVCTTFTGSASACANDQAVLAANTYLETVPEDIYEYAWTTEKVEYRTGANKSYKKAGTLSKDKFVKRTGITNSGWSRISIDDKEYFIPKDTLSTDPPEGLPIADGIKGEYQKYALSLLADFGWDDSELEPLIYLWNRESKWNPAAHNRHSGAHGIPQALPARKMASEGADYYTNAETQIRWGLKYIAGRYGSPSAAWAHSCSHGWY